MYEKSEPGDSLLTDSTGSLIIARPFPIAILNEVKSLGGGIAVQNRMAFQGEYFAERYGKKQSQRTPPIRRMLELGVPVGAGTDATRVSSYNPFLSLYWLITGTTVGGFRLFSDENRMGRAEALKLYTVGSSWFSSEEDKKGSLAAGQLADCVVLSGDYFEIPEEEIKGLESLLTIVGGRVVYAKGEFSKLAPKPLTASPDWSPVKHYRGYATPEIPAAAACSSRENGHRSVLSESGLWSLGCDCFAF